MTIVVNVIVGFAVGTAGGLIGLGGAELRLPYLVGVLGLTAHVAVPVNLAISLATILAAIAARLLALREIDLTAFFGEALALTVGAILAAWYGAGTVKRLSGPALNRLIFVLLLLLGFGLLVEAAVPMSSDGWLPQSAFARLLAGVLFGLLIGAISSVLGVAGGEVIIPTLVFGYGIPVKAAGSLSMLISLPTVAAGIVRHAQMGSFADRSTMVGVVAPMAAGSILGAICGGLLSGVVSASIIKIMLGILLIWSAWKVFAKH